MNGYTEKFPKGAIVWLEGNKPKKMGGENEFSSHFRIDSVSAVNCPGADSD
jgi:hypothetical protein